ncbi:uncharacterized protein LOC135384822 [Ornithodoros turicata]|uniref:uncharacterized protein LOC135384822 n=1 Tax=Ornithodoros turicata TaxID=34597 RepID=UPI0031396F0C
MRKEGIKIDEAGVFALTRAKARELKAKTAEKEIEESELANQVGIREKEPSQESSQQDIVSPNESDVSQVGEYLAPSSGALRNLVRIKGVARSNVKIIIQSGLLYRHYEDRRGKVVDQLMVPESLRGDILKMSHDNSWAGHLGVRKTKQRLLQEWYWPGCFKDVERYVRACDTCQRVGNPNERCKAPLTLVPVISEPFQRLVIDVVAPLPVSKSGSKYILTMICPATKFPEAVPLKEQCSAEIVDGLLSVFSRIGFPREIQCDNGSVFTSALTTTFLQKCGIKVIHSSLYHPQSNSVEKWHSVLKRVLRALVHDFKTDWEAGLPGAMFALRSVPHEATGFSPAELVYGRTLRSPMRLLREEWEDPRTDNTVVEYVLDLLQRLQDTREIAEANMRDSQRRAKTYYDRNARPRVYKENDKVLVLRPTRANKLQVHWDGPFKVVRKLSETTYMVEIRGKRKEVRTYHTNLMKPYVDSTHIVSVALNMPEEQHTEIPEWGEIGSSNPSIEDIVRTVAGESHFSDSQICDLRNLIGNFEGLFSDKPGKTDLICHDIELTTAEPVRSRSYRISPRQESIMRKEIQRMLDLKIIEAGESDYASPMIIVEAPGKEPRPCIDYRKLNAVTSTQVYPIPNLEERVERHTCPINLHFSQEKLAQSRSNVKVYLASTNSPRKHDAAEAALSLHVIHREEREV